MKNYYISSSFFKKLFLVVAFLAIFCSTNIFAQDTDEENADEDGLVTANGIPDPDAPLDNGVILLLAGGVGYGLIKLYQNNRQKANNTSH